MINLNYPKQDPILTRSPSLLGYSKLLYYIRNYTVESNGDLKSAIDTAVKQCMSEGLITDFLEKYTGEVTGMLFTEITAEEFAEIRAEEGERIGAEKKQREIAKNLKNSGLPIDLIAENTGLTPEEVEQL